MSNVYRIEYIPEFGKFGAIFADKPFLGWVVKGESYLECDSLAQAWLARQSIKAAPKARKQPKPRPCGCPVCSPDASIVPHGIYYCRADKQYVRFDDGQFGGFCTYDECKAELFLTGVAQWI